MVIKNREETREGLETHLKELEAKEKNFLTDMSIQKTKELLAGYELEKFFK